MRLIMERFRSFKKTTEVENIYFSGDCTLCSPEDVWSNYGEILASWQEKYGKLLILSKDKIEYEHATPLKKIIGFSAGARAAINLHKKHKKSGTELILIDPWLPSGFKKTDYPKLVYYGTSCFIARKKNKDRLEASGLLSPDNPCTAANPDEISFSDHLKYFLLYFN